MRRLCPLLLWLCLCLSPASAETVTIRSGEHADFSRLVLPMMLPAPWTFGRTLDGYGLRIGRPGVRFDLNQVFEKIPKLRLAAISAPQNGELRLQMNCACHAEIFEFRPTILVIDIRPGEPPKNSPFETPLDPPEIAAAPQPPPPRPAPRAVSQMPLFDWRQGLPALPAEATEGDQPPAERIATAQADLLKQLSRAAAQGLLQPDPAAFAAARAKLEEAASAQISHDTVPSALPPAEPEPPVPDLRLEAQTALDREVLAAEPPTTPAGGPCLPDRLFDLPHWGDESPVSAQLEAARGKLIGEFDLPEPKAVLRLAHLYLYLGFGAEVRMLLHAMHVPVPDSDLLRSLSEIIDTGTTRAPGRLSGQAGCTGMVALWSVLAKPHIAKGEVVSAGSVIQAFSALPLHLRRHLGPGLASRFIESGDLETARALRDAIIRAPGTPGPELQLLNARLDLANGKPDPADHAIAEVAKEDGLPAIEASILLVNERVARGEAVSPETAETIAALSHELGETDMGLRLRRAHLLALGTQGHFDAAFDELRALPDPSGDTARTLWQVLARQGPDTALLHHGLSPPKGPPLPRDSRNQIAARLLKLGFPEHAENWLKGLANPSPEERLLIAQAALALGKAAEALQELGSLSSPDATRLRKAIYDRLGLRGASSDMDLPASPQSGTTSAPPDGQVEAAPAGSLAEGQNLLKQSRMMRQSLDKLLEGSAPSP